MEFGEVYVINADGSDLQRLTDGGGIGDWSPDGEYFAYSDDPDADGHSDIYLIKADGSDRTRLTSGVGATCASAGLASNCYRFVSPRERPGSFVGEGEVYGASADSLPTWSR